MTYDELKSKVLEWVKENNEYKYRALQELSRAKIAYDNGIDVCEEIRGLAESGDLSDGYVLPVILGYYGISKLRPIELKQVRPGGGGGLDIDVDLASYAKPLLKQHLEEEYGKEYISSVGTYMVVGMASAIKDILRKENVPYAESNKFCSELDNDLSFAENMEMYRERFPELYKTYQQYKVLLDFVPKLSNVIRSVGKHAGGVLILDRPIYELCPVVRAQDEAVSAFVESSSAAELDDYGIIKIDFLSISVLDVIDNAISLAEKDGFYRIIDDDGLEKIVSKAYLLEKGAVREEDE